MLFVQLAARVAGRLQIGEPRVGVDGRQRGLEERSTETLALPGRVDADLTEVPVRLVGLVRLDRLPHGGHARQDAGLPEHGSEGGSVRGHPWRVPEGRRTNGSAANARTTGAMSASTSSADCSRTTDVSFMGRAKHLAAEPVHGPARTVIRR